MHVLRLASIALQPYKSVGTRAGFDYNYYNSSSIDTLQTLTFRRVSLVVVPIMATKDISSGCGSLSHLHECL